MAGDSRNYMRLFDGLNVVQPSKSAHSRSRHNRKHLNIRYKIGRCERIRTSDPFLPKEVRYQAAPHTEARRIPKPPIPSKIWVVSINTRPLSDTLAQQAESRHHRHQQED